MGKLNLVVNCYLALVWFAVGFSVAGYKMQDSFSSIFLFLVLLCVGFVIFSDVRSTIKRKNNIADSSVTRVAPFAALAVGGFIIGWDIGQSIWAS